MLAKAQEAQVLVEGTERNRVVTFQAEPSMRFLELLEAKKWLDARKQCCARMYWRQVVDVAS